MPDPQNRKAGDDEIKNDRSGSDQCGDDQRDRPYYYDDAHGYEEYDPDSDDDEKDE